MKIFNRHAVDLSADAIRNCLENKMDIQEITHLITVTCTGLSAPGLDLATDGIARSAKKYFSDLRQFYGLLCCDSCT